MDKKYSNYNLIKRICKELFKPYLIIVLILICFIVVSAVYTITPKLSGQAMTEIYNQLINKITYNGVMDFIKINRFIVYLLIAYIIYSLLSQIRNALIISICQNYVKNLRNAIYNKILRLPIRFFKEKTNGYILSLVTNDIESVNYYLVNAIREAFSEILNLIGACVMIYMISPLLLLVNTIIMVICILVILIVFEKSQKYFSKRQETIGVLNNSVEEAYTGHYTINLFNGIKFVEDRFSKENINYKKTSVKADFISSIAGATLKFIENIAIIVTAIISVFLNLKGHIEIGYIYTIISYTTIIIKPFSKIGSIINEFLSIIVSCRRIYKFLDQKEEKSNKLRSDTFKDKFLIDAISFAYDKDNNVLKNINMDISKGKKIAIVGKTGSGKTTLAKLLMNIYTVNSGKIEMDNVDINSFNNLEYLNNFNIITQDVELFQDTIMENIKYGNPNITEEEIKSIAKENGIDDIFTNLKDGYNTFISEDNLSYGVKQLICLMRSIVSDAPVLILDEATNMLNNEILAKIQNSLENIRKNKTLIIIAHNLETIKDSDMIYVLNDGEIAEFGTHAELISKGNLYKKMYFSKNGEEDW